MKNDEIVGLLKGEFGEAVKASAELSGDLTVKVDLSKLHEILQFLRSCPSLEFDYLPFMTAIDYSVYPKPKTKEAEAKLKEVKTKEEKIKEDEEKLTEAKEEEAESLKEEVEKLKEEIVKAKEEAEKLKEEAKEEEREKQFDVVYQLRSIKHSHDIRIKAEVGEEDIVESATDIWGSAGCDECEVYDMFGIKFKNHPDLRRILMPEDWVGYPYRKNYPLKGKEGDDEYLDTRLPEGQLKKPEHTRMP